MKDIAVGSWARSLLALVLTLLLLSITRSAIGLQVELLNAEHVTLVRGGDYLDAFPSVSRTNATADPSEDSLYIPPSVGSPDPSPVLGAYARSDPFEVEVLTDVHLSTDASWSMGAALTTLTFSPLVDATQTTTLNFSGWFDWFWSAQFVRLIDLTLDEELWSFAGTGTNPQGWTNGISLLLPSDTGYQSWINWEDRSWPADPRAIAEENPVTDFLATHEYELTLYTTTSANNFDAERILIELSGLEIIPEPATFTLLGLGSLVLVMVRRPR